MEPPHYQRRDRGAVLPVAAAASFIWKPELKVASTVLFSSVVRLVGATTWPPGTCVPWWRPNEQARTASSWTTPTEKAVWVESGRTNATRATTRPLVVSRVCHWPSPGSAGGPGGDRGQGRVHRARGRDAAGERAALLGLAHLVLDLLGGGHEPAQAPLAGPLGDPSGGRVAPGRGQRRAQRHATNTAPMANGTSKNRSQRRTRRRGSLGRRTGAPADGRFGVWVISLLPGPLSSGPSLMLPGEP